MFEKTLADLWQSVEYSNAWWICLFSVCAVLLCLFAARMAENTRESNVESTNEDSRRKKNIRRGRFPGKNNFLDSTSQSMPQPHMHDMNPGENENKRVFNKPYGDRSENAIAKLSYSPTNDLPPMDWSDKKFSGRNRLYIGNMGAEITCEDLEALFKPYGEVSEVFVNKEKSFGFIKLDYYANAVKARKELDGVLLKSKALKLKMSPSCAIVKVRNLSIYVTSELLVYAFSPFGEVENATVLVDERGKSTGEGFVDFVRKGSALQAIQKCREKCFFLSHSLRPVVVEPYEALDHTVGLLDKHFNKRNAEFYQERSIGPRLAELGSFEDEYGSRWKSLFDLYKQKEQAMRFEFQLERDRLEAQMEFARFEHETEALRAQLRSRELDKERQKKEWEAKERFAEEEKVKTEEQIRQSEENLQARLLRQQEDMKRRQEEASLLMQAHNLTSILDNQEHLEYDAPTSSTRDMTASGFNSFGKNTTRGGFNQAWNRPAMEGRWIRENPGNRGFAPKRRRNMVVLRVHGEEFVFPTSLHHQMQPRIPQMNMMKVHIPFTFKLLETSRSSYSELQCSMSSQVKYQVLAYWGVNIKELHIFLWRPWADIKNACAGGDFLMGYYQYLGIQLERTPHPDQVMTLNYNGQKALDLGTPPRLCYPLVIFLIRNDIDGNVHPDETVALINVVHIKDTVCTLPTSILGQYLKQANGQLSCLKQLYLATGNSGNYETQIPLAVAEPVEGGPSSVGSFCSNQEDSTFWNSSGEQLCVVCQTYPLSRALLPCRHTCICASCFTKLERCPMCRGPIKSYFCIRGEEYLDTKENAPSPKNDERPPARRRWFNGINWDDRLIDFLGFSR